MLSKTHRFHGHSSLNYVYSNGKNIRGPLTSLKVAPNERRQTYRLAIVISKKVAKSAVKRNRMRRRIYEIVRHLEPGIKAPYDIVITVFHEQLETLPDAELRKMVTDQLKQAGVISKNSEE